MNRTLRRLLALVLAGLLLSTVSQIAPVQAHMTNKLSHVWKHIKAKADKRYLAVTSADDLVRVAGTSSNSPVSLSTTTVTPMQTSITAPTSGFLMVVGHGGYSSTANSLLHCGVSVNGSTTWISTLALSSLVNVASGWAACDFTARIPVGAGTYTLGYAVHNDAADSPTFEGGALTVTFVKHGSAGGIGTGKPLSIPSGGGDIARR